MVALTPWQVVVAAYAGTPGTTAATAEATAIANAIGPTRVMREVGRTLTMWRWGIPAPSIQVFPGLMSRGAKKFTHVVGHQ